MNRPRVNNTILVLLLFDVLAILAVFGLPLLKSSILTVTTSGQVAQRDLEPDMYADISGMGGTLTASSNKSFVITVNGKEIKGQKAETIPSGVSLLNYPEYFAISPQPVSVGSRVILITGDWVDITVNSPGQTTIMPKFGISFWDWMLYRYYSPAWAIAIASIIIVANLVLWFLFSEIQPIKRE